jgi:hypothetical protein
MDKETYLIYDQKSGVFIPGMWIGNWGAVGGNKAGSNFG